MSTSQDHIDAATPMGANLVFRVEMANGGRTHTGFEAHKQLARNEGRGRAGQAAVFEEFRSKLSPDWARWPCVAPP